MIKTLIVSATLLLTTSAWGKSPVAKDFAVDNSVAVVGDSELVAGGIGPHLDCVNQQNILAVGSGNANTFVKGKNCPHLNGANQFGKMLNSDSEALCGMAKSSFSQLLSNPTISTIVVNLGVNASTTSAFTQMLDEIISNKKRCVYVVPGNFSSGTPTAIADVKKANNELVDIAAQKNCDIVRSSPNGEVYRIQSDGLHYAAHAGARIGHEICSQLTAIQNQNPALGGASQVFAEKE